MDRRHIGAVLLAAMAACAEPPEATVAPEPPETRASMAEIVAALQVALPLSLSKARFADPAHRAALEGALATLRRSSAALEAHGRTRDATFANLSRFLAGDAAEIERRFEDGRLEEARFLLGDLFENCVSCHSRLPGTGHSELGLTLFREVDVEHLRPGEELRLEVATHQFDRALERYEALFATGPAEGGLSATQLDLEGHVAGYLRLCIRVEADLERPRRGLATLAARPDVPHYLALQLATWSEALETLDGALAARDPLERARVLIAEGQTLRRFPMDRSGLVHDLVASSLLHRTVAAHPDPSPSSAEAYYWLGVTELHLETTPWIAEAESYLETAIRMAPGSPWAQRAYAVLEEETLAGYTGSSGEHLPPDVERWLSELRALAEIQTR